MKLSDILSVSCIALASGTRPVESADAALESLSELLSEGDSDRRNLLLHQLCEREKLQSTGIGDGVAIPHTAVEHLKEQKAALLLCPQGVEFDSIDKQPVRIFFAVIGPKSAASAHLKILAKISRLLRSPETRRRLLESSGAEQAYSLIEEHDAASIES